MPNIIIEDTEGQPYNYTVANDCTGRDLYNATLGVTGLGKPLNGCDGLTADAIRLLFQGREIPNNQKQVPGLQNNSRIIVVYNEQGGSNTVQDLRQNINFTICTCKSRAVNSTMFSKQQCQNRLCRRWRCFFCNANWNDQTMSNQQYTCGLPDCNYKMKINFEMVPMSGDHADVEIPNMRFCPNCYSFGGYGKACKYHTCRKCKHEFCYFCLKSKASCQTDNPSIDCYHVCLNPPKKQSYADIPALK
jgi:hypothetical protein